MRSMCDLEEAVEYEARLLQHQFASRDVHPHVAVLACMTAVSALIPHLLHAGDREKAMNCIADLATKFAAVAEAQRKAHDVTRH